MTKKAPLLIWITVVFVIVGVGVYLFISFLDHQATGKGGFGSNRCQSNPSPLLNSDITDLSKVKHIVPPVTTQQSGVKTHSYIFTDARVPVYAPVNSDLVDGAFYDEEGVGQYRLMFQISCEVFYMFDHIKEPVDAITASFPENPARDSRSTKIKNSVPFNAGDLIGYTTGTSFGVWDFGMYNTSKQNPYADLEPAYKDDLRVAHAVCPFDYFIQDKKQIYLKLLRNGDGSTLTNSQSLCYR